MKTVILNTIFNKYSSNLLPFNIEDSLFFDIETTGFSPTTSTIYLIGGMYLENNSFKTIQFFAENKSEEKEILIAFFNFMKKYKNLIHFNGDGFDIPFILEKCKTYDLPYDFSGIASFDIYKDTLCLKKLLRTENFKQKTLEVFLGLNRKDLYDGGELIKIYKEYLKKRDEESLELLLLHNVEDIMGMHTLISLYKYKAILDGNFSLMDTTINEYKDIDRNNANELILSFKLPEPLPSDISVGFNEFYIYASGKNLKIKVSLNNGMIKYFYEDYKNYYYLPIEDKAIHKSVAAYVDKEHRVKATALNCYTWIKADDTFISDEAKIKDYVIIIIKFICK